MKNLLLIIFLFILFGCKSSFKSVEITESLTSIINEFENQLIKDIKDDNINGSISAAIVHKNRIIWSKAFGPSSIDSSRIADTSVIYRTGSISKSFTAFLMMQMEKDGIIKLDDPVENYFSEIKNLKGYSDSTKITFRQLASHTSGLIREPTLQNANVGLIQDWENKILLSIPETSFEYRPGEQYNYSNIGYGILGLALSRAAKIPYMEMVKTRIFLPLNMTNSYFIVPNEKIKHLAKGIDGGPFGRLDLEKPEKEHEGRGYKVPNGAIYSTPNDLGKFMISIMGYSKLLDAGRLRQMQTNQTPNEGFRNYGLGFSLYQDNTISSVGHGGSVSGYTANFEFDKESEYGVILMRNYNRGITNLDLRSKVLLRKLKNLKN